MMEKALDASLELFDSSELYHKETLSTKVNYGNWDLRNISSEQLSGVMLRVKKDGRLGTAYTTTLEDPQSLLEAARSSAREGEEVPYSFSEANEFPDIQPYSKNIDEVSTEKMLSMCEKAKKDVKKELADISLNLKAVKESEQIRILTSGGTKAGHRASEFALVISAPIKGAGISVARFKFEISPFEYPGDMVQEFIRRYRWSENNVTPSSGKMPVIWTPDAAYMFALSLCSAISGEELLKKTSPLAEKYDKQIFSEKLTILDDPHTLRVGARGFDDEGIPTEKRALIEKGVLKSFLFDLRTGAKLGARSTGNGFKRGLFSGGTSALPTPWPANLWIQPGDSSLEEMIEGLDKGIILTGGLGFHSSNYTQGQIAVQAVGFMVENGEVKGRLENTMVSGNIYEDFARIGAISAQTEQGMAGHYPYILVDSMQVVGR